MRLVRSWVQFAGVQILVILATACAAQGPDVNHWRVVGPGGGGTTIGPVISPFDSQFVVERCDMTGSYVTRDSGMSWRMFNLRGGTRVLAFDPVDRHTIYAGNAALWRSADSGRSWSMVFPNPLRGTVEHQIGDHSEYVLSSEDSNYPGGEISAMLVMKEDADRAGTKSGKRLVLAFAQRGKPGIIVDSLDGGATWKRLAEVPESVLLLAAAGSDLIALSGATAYRISAKGERRELGSVPSGFKSASAGSSQGETRIYATGQNGQVYVSKDSGLHWQSATPSMRQTSGSFGAVATSAGHPEVAYVGFNALRLGEGNENLFNGIAKTANGGRTWSIVFKESTHGAENLKGTWIEQRASQTDENIWFDSPYSLGVAPDDPRVVYATDLFRTYRSLDGGGNWLEVNSRPSGERDWISRGLDVTTDYGVQFDPFDVRHVFIDYTDIGLFASNDGGQSWHGSSEGIPTNWRNTTYWLAFDPAERGLMWGAFSGVHDLPRPKMWRARSPLSFTGGIAMSTDGGRHWRPSNAGLPQDSVTHILLDASSPVGSRTLYACAFGKGVYKSTDGGKSWVQKNTGIAGDEPFAWRITERPDGALYLVVARRGEGRNPLIVGAVYRSTDKAEHWQAVPIPAGVSGPTGLSIDPRNSQRLYLTAWGEEGDSADRNGGVYVSEDGGSTWKPLFTEAQHVYDLTIDARNADTLYISGFDAAAYRSTDGGAHWERIRGYDFKWGHRVVLDPVDPTQIYITTYGGGVWHGPAAGDPNAKETIVTPVRIAQP